MNTDNWLAFLAGAALTALTAGFFLLRAKLKSSRQIQMRDGLTPSWMPLGYARCRECRGLYPAMSSTATQETEFCSEECEAGYLERLGRAA